MSDWKSRLNVVYSTNPDYKYDKEDTADEETLAKEKQLLRVALDKKNRKGKSVTLITGFLGSATDLSDLAKILKSKCGVGGSDKDGEILLQGDFRDRVVQILIEEGYTKARRIG